MAVIRPENSSSVLDYGLRSFYFDKRMAEINVCDAHEVVGRNHFLRQYPILNFCGVPASVMFTNGGPSVSSALDECATTFDKYLICAFARAI